MRTLQEFKEFCKVEIAPSVRVLEREREGIVKQMRVFFALLIVLLMLMLSIWFVVGLRFHGVIFLLMYFFLWASWYWRRKKNALTKGYRETFKKNVISRIVEFIDRDLKYEPDKCIEESKFLQSGIFNVAHDKYGGDDYVSGKVGQTQIEFSEFYSVMKSDVIFKGLFFVASFNKTFAGWTIIVPDRAEKKMGRMGRAVQSAQKSGGKLLSLDDPEFEKEFAAYGTDEIEARYILSNSLMRRITEFQRKAKKQISLSFFGSQVYIAIPYYENLFEPRLFGSLLDFQSLQKYFEDLALAIGIVEDLNLNTRIWTKE